ncbi:MAG: hypothetical protein F4Z49_14330, partial [Gemmatimonadetes bacterium]|nr:hypothetical protein [Gemmatimonadota bacterium]
GGDSPTEPAVQVPARIDVTPGSIAFESVGQTLTLAAIVIDTNRNEITGAAVEWSTSNPMIATVTQGIVVSTGYGSAQITAKYGSVSRTVNVTVKL